ncbi:hypothetical protein ANN_05630 [Periplaneta americana]|uniref:Uncharacterized protein n=1 Tax=Periplaneta americana TaxID=6978 RepID=A0ABQ8TC81_PERAM|nr:hypothetical protein ANN_05630 [Periplaneta americana]
MAGLCEGGNEPAGSLKASKKPDGSVEKTVLVWNPQADRKRGRPKNIWKRTTTEEAPEIGKFWNRLFVPHLPATLQDLRHRIVEAVNSITRDQLILVWQEMDHRFDVCRATHDAHVECLQPREL